MRKYLLTLSTIALFAFGFAASDEDTSGGSQQVEQKQETETERKAREEREKQERINDMIKEAYEYGKKQGIQYTYYQKCNQHFTSWYFTPSTDEQFEIFNRYKAEYDRGFNDGQATKRKMDSM